jgi:hypothetical protein
MQDKNYNLERVSWILPSMKAVLLDWQLSFIGAGNPVPSIAKHSVFPTFFS